MKIKQIIIARRGRLRSQGLTRQATPQGQQNRPNSSPLKIKVSLNLDHVKAFGGLQLKTCKTVLCVVIIGSYEDRLMKIG